MMAVSGPIREASGREPARRRWTVWSSVRRGRSPPMVN